MRTSRALGLVFLATATLAQQQQSVEITSEPSHHLVFQNEYVRVFDVTVAPKASTLVHRHNNDYLFVTLGDSDVVNARVGEKPVPLHLKDGEVRYTPGNFAHAAINESERPFHNITIELLKSSTNVKTCTGACSSGGCLASIMGNIGDKSPLPGCSGTNRLISADQWSASMAGLPPNSTLDMATAGPTLLIAVSKLDLISQTESAGSNIKKGPGGLAWVPSGVTHTLANNGAKPAQFVTLEFKPDKP